MDDEFFNLLYLLWEETQDRDRWPDLLAKWTDLSKDEASVILDREQVSDETLRQVAEANGYTIEEVKYGRLLGEDKIKDRNIQYLLGQLKHGEGQKLADEIDVASETVSKWRQGDYSPSSKNTEKILSYFRAPDVNISKDPLFLMMKPMTGEMIRRDLQDKMGESEISKLKKYYDAIVKLIS
jgi:transcriptional regulator with XRE-family HTH domain